MFIDDFGVACHGDEGGVDHDADADHVAISTDLMAEAWPDADTGAGVEVDAD